ncbi:MAG TPA: hypothetical protein VFB95_13645 [Candidatus Cryosericum sp.]|nr:hypothetical protein [Candidatus Cryosericum sp.]
MTKLKSAQGRRIRTPRKASGRKVKVKPLDDKHQQWGLKAGFAPDGRMLTLEELTRKDTPSIPMDHLTQRQLRDLTLERLRQFKNYTLCVLGRRRPVSRRTALKEVREGTSLGEFLVDTERNIVRLILERARSGKTRSR